jgi:hypothetical protein
MMFAKQTFVCVNWTALCVDDSKTVYLSVSEGEWRLCCLFVWLARLRAGGPWMTVIIVGWVSWFFRLVHAELVMSAGDGVLP